MRVRAAATRVANGHTTNEILPVLAPTVLDVPVQNRCGSTLPVLNHRESSGCVAHNDMTAVRCRRCQQLSERELSPRGKTGFAEIKDDHAGVAICQVLDQGADGGLPFCAEAPADPHEHSPPIGKYLDL